MREAAPGAEGAGLGGGRGRKKKTFYNHRVKSTTQMYVSQLELCDLQALRSEVKIHDRL